MIMDVVVDDVVGQARSQDFFYGGGGCVPQEPGPNN